ncbi:MFS transporter [Bacillus nitratireducens]|uniref:MFS transporter n=1 Tax=Bacillus nitratireducens TaxID=2026193 RepID=UPI00300B8126
MFALLWNNKDFLKLWLSQVISQLGDGITRVILIYLIGTSSQNSFLIGMVIFIQLLPTTLFSFFFGPVIDTYSKKWIMFYSDIYRMIIIFCMIPFINSPYVLLFLLGIHGLGTALFNPAKTAIIPSLVGTNKVTEAISISQSTYSVMQIIAPSIGGVILFFQSYSLSFFINGITFLISAILIMLLSKQRIQINDKIDSYWNSIKLGITTVTNIPELKFLLIILTPVSLTLGILNTNLVAILLQEVKVPAVHFGFLEAIVGIGAIIGALFSTKFLKQFSPNRILISGSFSIGFLMMIILFLKESVLYFGLSPVYLWCTFIGITTSLLNIPISSLFILVTPEKFRGRGSTIMTTVMNLSSMIGLLLGGWIANLLGGLITTVISGAILIIFTTLFPFLKGYQSLKTPSYITLNKQVERGMTE